MVLRHTRADQKEHPHVDQNAMLKRWVDLEGEPHIRFEENFDAVQLPNDVAFFSSKRAGQAGRNGDTIGILACANFECSANVRNLPSVAYIGFDVEAARQQRIEALGQHVRKFLQDVRDGS
ncbi:MULTISPECIES: FBP domain-containing protein [unclassified Cryobacterium]|uniref:FBP domain-containing protein n=1 Tax=unclassified Cryobacterium TaxID=2649013 RepID=UPI001E5D65F8|nr:MULTISPECIES: FBP domain-containing protein [unclassified Cryobacterium]